VKRAKVAQADPKARREVEAALTRADAIAKALEAGEPVSKYRSEIFALGQTFADPAGAKDNASVQSASAGIYVIGQAESNALKTIEAAEARIAKGEAAAKSDAERTKAWRQHEDLETMRHALEGLDYTGLTNAQEAQGAQILDRARAIALKVACGETYAQNEAAFKQVIADFNALKKAAPKPPAKPPVTPKPPQKPTPVKPKPLTPGGTYTVRRGDYLRTIAQRELGDADRYKEIVQLSKGRYPSLAGNPDLIFPGWKLTLPKK
jgi:LysM repeat protein